MLINKQHHSSVRACVLYTSEQRDRRDRRGGVGRKLWEKLCTENYQRWRNWQRSRVANRLVYC